MLFHVRMEVKLPADMTAEVAGQCPRIKIVSAARCRSDEQRDLLAGKIFRVRACGVRGSQRGEHREDHGIKSTGHRFHYRRIRVEAMLPKFLPRSPPL